MELLLHGWKKEDLSYLVLALLYVATCLEYDDVSSDSFVPLASHYQGQ